MYGPVQKLFFSHNHKSSAETCKTWYKMDKMAKLIPQDQKLAQAYAHIYPLIWQQNPNFNWLLDADVSFTYSKEFLDMTKIDKVIKAISEYGVERFWFGRVSK